jgi:hypothetical protein
LMLIRVRGSQMRPTWSQFAQSIQPMIAQLTSYSLRGWLFSLSTILIASGSIVVMGFLGEPTDVAHLQIAMIVYTGISASITGGMTPLTTIVAASDIKTDAGRARVAVAARRLVDETAFLSAAAIVGIAVYGRQVIALLIGEPELSSANVLATYMLALLVNVPALAVTPFFTFRFALVGVHENARYSAATLWWTVIALGLGTLVAALTGKLIAVALGIAVALSYRGTKAYEMGAGYLPEFDRRHIWMLLLRNALLPVLVAAVLTLLGFAARLGDLLQIVVYGVIVGAAYLWRVRTRA